MREVAALGERPSGQQVARLIAGVLRAAHGAQAQSACIDGKKQRPDQRRTPRHAQHSLQVTISTEPKRSRGEGLEGRPPSPQTTFTGGRLEAPPHFHRFAHSHAGHRGARQRRRGSHREARRDALVDRQFEQLHHALARGGQRAERRTRRWCWARRSRYPRSPRPPPRCRRWASGRDRRGSSSGPGPLGSYVVRPGDTLNGIAVRSGVTLERGGVHERHRSEGSAADRHRAQAAHRGEHVVVEPRLRASARCRTRRRIRRRSGSAQLRSGRSPPRTGCPRRWPSAVAWQESGFQQQPRLGRQRPRRDADPARHVVLDQQQPGALAARARARRRTTSMRALCTSASCCTTPAGTSARRSRLLPGSLVRSARRACCRRPVSTSTMCSPCDTASGVVKAL